MISPDIFQPTDITILQRWNQSSARLPKKINAAMNIFPCLAMVENAKWKIIAEFASNDAMIVTLILLQA